MFASLMKHAHEGLIAITMTSQWARWRPRSRASRLFTQPFIQAQIKKTSSKLHATDLCVGNSPVTGTGEFPRIKGCRAEMFAFDDVIMAKWDKIHNFVIKAKNTQENARAHIKSCAHLYICNKPILFDPYHEMTKLWNNKMVMFILLSFRIEDYFAHISTCLDKK